MWGGPSPSPWPGAAAESRSSPRGADGLAGASREVVEAGGEAVVVPTDVSDATAVFEAAQRVADAWGPIVETAKFFAEEEILRRRELRSPIESRRSLTKFITIIVIAACLEALVMVFKTGRTDITESIYPAVLFGSSMLALVALGVYQWLSSRIATPPPAERREAARDAAERE